MANIKKALCNIIGVIYIPEEVMEWKEKKLLHISDTPSGFYPELKKLIRVLKPDYIVHTGDMADNIKLELYPNSAATYEKYVKKLAGIMEDSAAELLIALGNHDSCGIVSKYFSKGRIIEKSDTACIEGLHFRISHFPGEVLQAPADYNLFGHDLTLKSGASDGRAFFNGIASINIIGLDSGSFYMLDYPAGTDDARLGKGKIGL